MLFDVRVLPNEWTVEIVDEANTVVSRRTIEFTGADPRFPLAQQSEREAFDAADPTAALCRTNDPALLQTYFDAFLAKQRVAGDDRPIVTFGRYLFASLIGAAAWQILRDRANGAPTELALSWGTGKEDLAALPWEAMHDGHLFLMQHTNVGIVRRVTGGVAIDEEKLQLASPPKVLVVVGTEPKNEVIRAGVEYLRMILALRDAELDLALRTFLLLEASEKKLRTALRHVEPDVVHFICHGAIDLDGPFLELVNEEDKNRPAKLRASQIFTLLSEHGSLPRVVVITACESAAVPRKIGQIATPLAAELVKAGVPLVVGMAGRVSDQACRLFTRRFYESLISKGDVTQATAQGRRAAIVGGRSDPRSTVDWALPVLFFSDSIRTTKLPVRVDEDEKRWSSVTARYQPASFPAFCDRSETTSRFDILNSPEPAQITLRTKPFQVLLINVPRREKDAKYGCTRLLLELASKAIRDGHLACIVTKSSSKTTGAPRSVPQLLSRIVDALDDTLIHFNLECPGCRVAAADFRESKQDCATCADLRAVYSLPDGAGAFEDEHGTAVRTGDEEANRKANAQRAKEANALRRAFECVAALGRLRRPEKRRDSMRLVFLVDDLHDMAADAVAALLDHYLSARGLLGPASPVRIVLGLCSVPLPSQVSAVDAVTNWLAATGSVEQIDLDRFAGAEEFAAYEHFLLHWEDPVTRKLRPMTIAAQVREQVLGMFQRRFQGVPSRLTSAEIVQTVLDLNMDMLVDAEDDVVLRNIGGQAG